MNRIAGAASTILAALLTTATAAAQQPAGQIAFISGVVEVQDASGSAMATPGQLVSAPEIIRTGAGSFVDLVLAVNGRVLLDGQSQIEVRRLGASPLVWLESGKVTVRSQNADVQILTKFGLFSAAEWPFEMELTNSGGTLNVVVTAGRIRTQNLDASAVTFGVSGANVFRTYTTGTIHPSVETTSSSPNISVMPCLVPGSIPGYPPAQMPPSQNPVKR